MSEQQRAAYMAQQNAMRRQALQQQSMPQQQRQVHFADQPQPPKSPMAHQPRIPSMNKLNVIKKELEEAEPMDAGSEAHDDRTVGVEGTLSITHQVMQMVIFGLMLVTTFMLQGQLRYFWIGLIAIVLFSFIGLRLYNEWMLRAAEETDNDNAVKYASIMLYVLNGFYAFTALAVCIVLLWNVYTIVKRNMHVRKEKSELQEALEEERSDAGSMVGMNGGGMDSQMPYETMTMQAPMRMEMEDLPPPPSDFELQRIRRRKRRERFRELL